ncbi:MAG TPA: ACT domain-containing protein [Actinomycetota bacterium]|nr:ACT domain-containing protein [Actinomycetota bacterium]
MTGARPGTAVEGRPEPPPPVARLLGELRALDRAYSPGHHGRWSARRRAELVDRCLRELFAAAGPPPGVALAALGGYGRGELAPASDLDLLIVHRGRAEDLRPLAERLLYPLWDAGLAVGHAVRTPDECLAFAAGRLDAATSMLDARFLAGDPGVLDDALAPVRSWLREDPRGFATRLAEDAREREERAGATSRVLEPDLKEGRGGLRDLHALAWVARVAFDGDLGALVGAGLLRERERRALEDAWEFLTRARSAIHLETGKRSDRLILELQPGVAAAMGFVDEPGLAAPDGLMRAVFEHARQVEHVGGAVIDRFLAGDRLVAGVELDPTPAGVLRAFADLATRSAPPAPGFLDAVERADVPDPVPWDDEVREAFLRLLRAGEGAAAALDALDRMGLLVRFLPEWAPVRCRPQRDPYHRSPVDVHLLDTLAGAARLLGGEDEDDPVAREALPLVPDPDGFLLGALLHDVGKVGLGGHVAAGVRQARSALDRMGLPAACRDLASFLVEHHLLLSDTATRRDLEDDDLVLDVAATVGDQGRLAALYLLTVADARATGPAAWTPWRRTLVRELVAKVQHVLERGEMGPELAERLADRAEALRRLLAGEDPAEVERFLRRVPHGYLAAVPTERAAAHLRLLRAPLGAAEVRTLVEPGARPGTHALTVVAPDRPGLLSWIAGALALAGLSILTAQVFTTEDGVAVDLFEVEGAFEPQIDEARWRSFRRSLRRALEGRLDLAHLVEERRRHYPRPRAEIPVRVSVDNGASDFFTVVEVGAADRLGLLFDVTRTLAELGLDVHLAKVATYGARVVDAFYVRDVLGRKLEDPGAIAALERALVERLGG